MWKPKTIRRLPAPRGGPSRRSQPGYALLVVLLVFSVFVIGLAVAVPRWKTEIQRDRETEAIDRAHQYVEGIKRYYHKFGAYPPNLARLKETNGIHYLRQAWPDPLTHNGKWQLLQYTDLKKGEVVGGGLGIGGAPNGAPQAGKLGGGNGSLFGPTLMQEAGAGLGSGAGTGPGASLFGDSGSDSGSDAAGDTSASGAATKGATTASSGTTPGGTTAASSSGGTTGGLFGAKTGATHGPVFGGAGIVGVASRSKQLAVHAFNRKHRPDQWQFVYNPMQDRSLLGPGVGNGPALGQPPGSGPASPTNNTGSSSSSPSSSGGSGTAGGSLFGPN